MNTQYEVLNPWAEVDPVMEREISPRLKELKDQTIGLFTNNKRASRMIVSAVKENLGRKYPTLKFSQYDIVGGDLEITEIDGKREKAEFEDWLKVIDVFIGAVGD